MNDAQIAETHRREAASIPRKSLSDDTANKTRNVALAVIAVALVLLIGFLALAGTKVLDISALQGKGGAEVSKQAPTPGTQ